SVFAAIIVVLFWIFFGGDDPTQQAYVALYGLMAVLGVIIILFAQAIVSIAIVVYFRAHHPDDHHWWATLVAPAFSFLAQIYVIYLLVSQMGFLGAGVPFANWLIWIDLVVLAVGLAGAFYLKRSDPQKYDQIGRLIFQGTDVR